MWVLEFTTISEQRRISWIMSSKDDISVWLRQHFIFLLLRTREGYMPTITKSRLIAAGEIPFKHAWAKLQSIEIDWDSAIIDLAYLFAGLVTITQSRLVHCILQGVEHTDPTEWSNSHCSIGDKFFSFSCSLFFFLTIIQSFIWWRLRNIYIIQRHWIHYDNVFQLHIHIMWCLRTDQSYICYISISSTCHSNTI